MSLKRTLFLMAILLVFAAATAALGLHFIPLLTAKARIAGGLGDLIKSDAQEMKRAMDIYVDLTFATPAFLKRIRMDEYIGRYPYGQPFLLTLNTHAGSIEHLVNLEGKLFLIDDQGVRFPSLGSPILTSEHHNTYMVFFPAVDHQGRSLFEGGRKKFQIEVLDIQPFPRRIFQWDLPIRTTLAEGENPGESVKRTLMLAVALIGALIITLSPCTVHVAAFYGSVYGTVVLNPPAGGRAPGKGPRPMRCELLRIFLPFALGFILIFSVGGALLGLTGSALRDPIKDRLGDYYVLVRVLAGGIMVYFAWGLLRPGSGPKGRLGHLGSQMGRYFRKVLLLGPGGDTPEAPAAGARRPLTPFTSLMMGVAMSTDCSFCVGTGIFYPLAVYAGTTAWYWGMATLGAFSLSIALPMIFLALGVKDLGGTLSRKMKTIRVLNGAAGLIIGFVGVMLALGEDPHFFTNLVIHFLYESKGWFAQ